MTGAQAREVLRIGLDRVALWKQRLLPAAGEGVQMAGNQISLQPTSRVVPELEPRTWQIGVWAQFTFDQASSNPAIAPTATFEYPPLLVATAPSEFGTVYDFGDPNALPDVVQAHGGIAGDFLVGQLWSGEYSDTETGIFLSSLTKSAIVTWYVRGHYTLGGAVPEFDTGFKVGNRTITLRQIGQIAPNPPVQVETSLRVLRAGSSVTLQALAGNPGDSRYELLTLSSA